MGGEKLAEAESLIRVEMPRGTGILAGALALAGTCCLIFMVVQDRGEDLPAAVAREGTRPWRLLGLKVGMREGADQRSVFVLS
jgi:hypothetical protein